MTPAGHVLDLSIETGRKASDELFEAGGMKPKVPCAPLLSLLQSFSTPIPSGACPGTASPLLSPPATAWGGMTSGVTWDSVEARTIRNCICDRT